MKSVRFEEKQRAGDAPVDEIILGWSKSGVLKIAAQKAIEASHKAGRAVTIVENGIVYRFLPDGSRQEIRRLNRARATRFTSGTVYIR